MYWLVSPSLTASVKPRRDAWKLTRPDCLFCVASLYCACRGVVPDHVLKLLGPTSMFMSDFYMLQQNWVMVSHAQSAPSRPSHWCDDSTCHFHHHHSTVSPSTQLDMSLTMVLRKRHAMDVITLIIPLVLRYCFVGLPNSLCQPGLSQVQQEL